jgi:hypothetical protein
MIKAEIEQARRAGGRGTAGRSSRGELVVDI